MDLVRIELEGFRRFKERVVLKTSGKLTALVGANESGKSSILHAILLLCGPGKLHEDDVSSGFSTSPRIEGVFSLTEQEKRILGIEQGTEYKFSVVRHLKQKDEFRLTPEAKRCLGSRREMLKSIREVYRSEGFQQWSVGIPAEKKVSFEDVEKILVSSDDRLSDDGIANLKIISANFSSFRKVPGTEIPTKSKIIEFTGFIAAESAADLTDHTISVSKNWIPTALEFTGEEGRLQDNYSLSKIFENPQPAILNLAKMADLDLGVLNTAATQHKDHEVQKILFLANQKIKEEFANKWQQAEISIWFSLSGDKLTISIREGDGFGQLKQRSDGLKQYISLLAFMHKAGGDHKGSDPLLLIDEAEQHLHYDAQSDLIEMFGMQKFASKVIYTTHSIGCLPRDLALGTRLVLRNGEFSTISSKCWHTDEGEYKGKRNILPLLAGMGAESMAFFLAKPGLMVEGPTEMILLPQLFREATESEDIGFQVLPGLSNASKGEKKTLRRLPFSESKTLSYFLDNDDGGDNLKKDLKDLDIEPDHIHQVDKQGLEKVMVEDLIRPDVFAYAVNELLERHNLTPDRVEPEDLPAGERTKRLGLWLNERNIRELQKTDIAEVIFERLLNERELQVLDPCFAERLQVIAERIQAQLGLG